MHGLRTREDYVHRAHSNYQQGLYSMVQTHDGNNGKNEQEDLERLLSQGVNFVQEPQTKAETKIPGLRQDDDDENDDVPQSDDLHDLQGALGLFAEASQDMATASLELGLGRHFACVDYCNQVAEKAAQAVSLLRFGRRSMYDHDLRALGELVGATQEILELMHALTPFHPEAFYADTPPEEADEVIDAEQASGYIQSARTILRWARNIVLSA